MPRARSLSRMPAVCPCLLQGSGLTWSHHGEKKLDFCDATLLEAARRDSDPVLREFLRLLALCHTVMVEEKGGGLATVVDVLGVGLSCHSGHRGHDGFFHHPVKLCRGGAGGVRARGCFGPLS